MRIVDLHSDVFTDIAWRVSRGERDVFDTHCYPRFRAGGVDTVICVFWVEAEHLGDAAPRFRELRSRVLADLRGSRRARIVTDLAALEEPPAGRVNVVLGIEGMNFVDTEPVPADDAALEAQMQDLDDIGVRHAMLVWNDNNALASGTGAALLSPSPGLTEAGRRVAASMERRGWMLDVSHLDRASFWEMLEATEAPLMASHSNAFSLCGHERNLRDEQLRALAERGGLIGLNAYYEFVHESHPSLDAFIDHAVHIAGRIGVEHVAFGFDFLDFLPEQHGSLFAGGCTEGLARHGDVPALIERMGERGFTDAEIEQIAHGNALQWFTRTASLRGSRYSPS